MGIRGHRVKLPKQARLWLAEEYARQRYLVNFSRWWRDRWFRLYRQHNEHAGRPLSRQEQAVFAALQLVDENRDVGA